MAKREVWEESMTQHDTRGAGRISKYGDGKYAYEMGDVLTPWGIVSVYMDDSATKYEFVLDHRYHVRTENFRRSARGATQQAAKFAQRVFSGGDATHG